MTVAMITIVHRQPKRPVKWIGRPTNQTLHSVNVERLQRLLVMLGHPLGISPPPIHLRVFDVRKHPDSAIDAAKGENWTWTVNLASQKYLASL
jgi:hypothetical protein